MGFVFFGCLVFCGFFVGFVFFLCGLLLGFFSRFCECFFGGRVACGFCVGEGGGRGRGWYEDVGNVLCLILCW